MTGEHTVDDDTPAHKRTFQFVYQHSARLVAVSIVWFVASLPLVTVGPATLGAYAAIRSLKENGRISRSYVLRALRLNGIHAALLSFLPLLFVASAALYLGQGVALGNLTTVAVVSGLYVGGYLGVALVPTFVLLADGETPTVALRHGYLWVASNPAATLALALATTVLFVVTALLTVGFVLLFPALVFSYHLEVLAADLDAATVDETRTAPVEHPA